MSLNPLHLLRHLLEAIYGLYVVIVFVAVGLVTLILIALPGLGIGTRRSIAHAAARLFFALSGIRIRVDGLNEIPDEPCVIVANHASYLDGVVLKGVLPARFSFVIKKEVAAVPLAGMLLRRIGSEFVDRFNRHAGGLDARRLIKAADSGQALAFFPEGTFVAEPGLGKFHSGAFTIAARAKLPVVPLAIRGTRHILPSGRFLPRPGRIEIEILPAVRPPAELEQTATVAMTRDVSRARILAALPEPDLAESDGVADLQASRHDSAET